uniref:Uncharacterized protein n=1 Tax=Anguilla anguilla TaxID=7936 RepID=A0A0E9VWS2_ANGAN
MKLCRTCFFYSQLVIFA